MSTLTEAMSFHDMGKELGMSTEGVRVVYNRAMGKMRMHMKSYEEWVELLGATEEAVYIATFVMAALTYGAMIERGMEPTRVDQSRARSAFKMAYRMFTQEAM